jgi:hypothetical protein
MAISRTAMVDDDGTGTTGTVINNAWKQQFYDQIDASLGALGDVGAWVAIPYSAGNFTAAPGTWTVSAANQVTFVYCRINRLVVLDFYIANSTLAGTPGPLIQIALPSACRCAHEIRAPMLAYDGGGTGGLGLVRLTAGASALELYKNPGLTAWAAGASVGVMGTLSYMSFS